MIEYDPQAQPRFVEPSGMPPKGPSYFEKILKDPDFISLDIKDETKFELRWAAYDDCFRQLDALSELVESVDGKGMISKNAVPFKAEGSGLETVLSFENRVRGFSMLTKSISLHLISNVDLSTTHETSTNEVWLTLNRSNTAARYVVSQCVAITAREGLGENIDLILDEFSEYLPILQR